MSEGRSSLKFVGHDFKRHLMAFTTRMGLPRETRVLGRDDVLASRLLTGL